MSFRVPPICLFYRGIPLKRSGTFGFTLNVKLSWNNHIKAAVEKSQRRINLLGRLAATKSGATQDILTTAYKAYVYPVMEYGSDVGSILRNKKIKLNTSNIALYNGIKIITGEYKTIIITAKQLQTEYPDGTNRSS
ncbi:hypothetical protein NPIL_318611 [Nephila pilipes]|uniref:Uncharacterized protein n=1 Tax=Nephila pilipes TaxID=299642 RepID=A0A8X6PJV2_NEPPI|nr:hypothetical protein NPIL_318611 [Nephila pilipes]